MSEKETHPIRNGIIATVSGSIVFAILTSLFPAVRNLLFKALGWIWSTVKFFIGVLTNNYEIPGWLILIFIALTAPTCIRIIATVRKKKKPKEPKEPGVFDLYRSDCLFGAIWEWSYSGERIINLSCLCPECEGELVYLKYSKSPLLTRFADEPDHIKFKCEKCDKIRGKLMGDMSFALGTVEREIRRKIRTGEWKESINRSQKSSRSQVQQPARF